MDFTINYDTTEYSTPPYESEHFWTIVEQLKDGIEAYIEKHDFQQLIPFKEQLLKDLDLFADGKEMEHEYGFSVAQRVDEECLYVGFHFERDSIELDCGGSEYNPGVGHDSFSSWVYSLSVDGYEDSSEVWADSFNIIYELFTSEYVHFTIEYPDEFFFDDEDIQGDEDEDESDENQLTFD